ncbi:PREDICTED: axonemal 84 kDa protein [Ceratosolen solmsi marchali]|uniref:Axonemal 84 kDa protein n=1 Tax=Ceratosolen solmsi marchali TaxID=326594 RepID=A0AAJ6YJL1_9HYME|nr:PREDICTED: axonemal 84 kDa protein [Ceratosolen solmsi marchali]
MNVPCKWDVHGHGTPEYVVKYGTATQLVEELQNEIDTETFKTENKIVIEKEQMWCCYRICKNLPDTHNVQYLNTFLFIQSLDDSKISVNTLSTKFQMRICVRQKYRDSLQIAIDAASYNLLRQIERDTIKVDLKNAKYIKELSSLVCCFWAFIKLPISMKQISEKDRKAIEIDFEEIHLTIKLPLDIDCYSSAIRVIWLSYDYFSDQSASFHIPELPDKYQMKMDLLDFCISESNYLHEMREEQKDTRVQRLAEKKALIKRILNPPTNESTAGSKSSKRKKHKEKSNSDFMPPIEAGPETNLANPEEVIAHHEDETKKERRRLFFTKCKKTEVNLRKYIILGGHYQIALINQPPQPKDFRRDISLTTLQLPNQLEFIKFSRPYKAPPTAPESERTPEIIEAEMKALEASMEALILVTLKLPETKLWFEPPLVAHWLSDEKIWSTEDVHDIKYNEEKQTITFRTGKFGIHGLVAYRFINLPFQSWELKPEADKNGNGVILSITGAIIQLEFLIREDMVCLNSVVGAAHKVFENIEGEFIRLHKLIDTLRRMGCDFFPEQDAASYIKGISVKHPIAVAHLLQCMGLVSTAYSFSWSRWNATRGYRDIVVQIKEIHGFVAKQKSNAILLVTPFHTSVVNCSEVSTEFCSDPADEKDYYYADVYQYALKNAGIKSQLAIKDISFKLSITVTKLLEATNIINMSA